MAAIINDSLNVGRNAANTLNGSLYFCNYYFCYISVGKANLEISWHYSRSLNFMRLKSAGIAQTLEDFLHLKQKLKKTKGS